MRQHIIGAAVLALGLLVVGAVPAHAQLGFSITGTIRDFDSEGADPPAPGFSNHPDFETPPIAGLQTGIVQAILGADNKPVYAPAGATVTTTDAAHFNQWYNDTAGINLSAPITLALTDQGGGNFGYDNTAFFPIDDQLLGNQGRDHNFSFTTEFHTSFVYQTGQNFTFTGDDDVWVFINRKLAIDLGGIHGPESATVDLDTAAASLGITVGNTYSLDIFQAERHTSGSDFSIITNINLISAAAPEPGTVSLLGLGLVLIPTLARRRRA